MKSLGPGPGNPRPEASWAPVLVLAEGIVCRLFAGPTASPTLGALLGSDGVNVSAKAGALPARGCHGQSLLLCWPRLMLCASWVGGLVCGREAWGPCTPYSAQKPLGGGGIPVVAPGVPGLRQGSCLEVPLGLPCSALYPGQL